jgi:predicted GTPase
VLVKLRIGQMNDLISLIINAPNRATKRPAKVLGEILALREDLVFMAREWDAVKGRFGFDYRRRRKGAGL